MSVRPISSKALTETGRVRMSKLNKQDRSHVSRKTGRLRSDRQHFVEGRAPRAWLEHRL